MFLNLTPCPKQGEAETPDYAAPLYVAVRHIVSIQRNADYETVVILIDGRVLKVEESMVDIGGAVPVLDIHIPEFDDA